MEIEIKVPLLPESVNDAVVAIWHKGIGEIVAEGDILAELETDKIMLEVPTCEAGVLTQLNKAVGDRVESGMILCVVDTDAKPTVEQVTKQAEGSLTGHEARKQVLIDDIQSYDSMQSATSSGDRLLRAGPSKRRMHFTQGVEGLPTQVSTQSINASAVTALSRVDRVVPMTRLRQTIAGRLLKSQHETASLTTFNEVNLGAMMALRLKYKEAFMQKYGVKLGYMSFFTQACCRALQAFPEVNASLDGSNIVYHDYCDIGIAVSTDKGLFVPIIRHADQLDLAGIEQQILQYSIRAKANKITLADLQGGTFSITNGGIFGSLFSTPILNIPQSAILGMHNIIKRPVVEDDKIVIRPMMYLALTYDHRMIDGSQAVRFLVMIKTLLEDPSQLLLQI